jgi:hypothetical protein
MSARHSPDDEARSVMGQTGCIVFHDAIGDSDGSR